MPPFKPSETALILIDVQQGFSSAPNYWGIQPRSTPNLEANIEKLLSAFRSSPESHIFHVHHHSLSTLSPLHPETHGVKPMPCGLPLPGEKVVIKHMNSAFVGTNLEEMIRERNIKRLVFCGLTTCHCVSTSIRMASNLEIVEHLYGRSEAKGEFGEIVLVNDATAMWGITYGDEGKELDGETAHQVHLESLNGEFCDAYGTQQVIEELLASQ